MNEKNNIRVALRQLSKCFSTESLVESALAVIERVESLPIFSVTRRIVLYHALPDELPTDEMIKRWRMHKTILLPRVCGDSIEIVTYQEDALSKGAFNILEPTGGDIVTDFTPYDLAIVPGVAFDRKCNRLGRGKGYYDRFLSHFPGVTIGICADFRLIDAIPVEEHDICMDRVITPSVCIFNR